MDGLEGAFNKFPSFAASKACNLPAPLNCHNNGVKLWSRKQYIKFTKPLSDRYQNNAGLDKGAVPNYFNVV